MKVQEKRTKKSFLFVHSSKNTKPLISNIFPTTLKWSLSTFSPRPMFVYCLKLWDFVFWKFWDVTKTVKRLKQERRQKRVFVSLKPIKFVSRHKIFTGRPFENARQLVPLSAVKTLKVRGTLGILCFCFPACSNRQLILENQLFL